MRTPLLVLLLLSFLLQGVLPAHAGGNRCPMHDAGVTMKDMDCCNDPLTAAATGELCKADVACATFAASLPIPSSEPGIVQSPDHILPSLSLPLSTLQLAAIWRPPALN